MAHLRATKKVLSRLLHSDLHEIEPNETALGDWYVNRIVVHRRPLLVLVSSMSLLPIVVPARDIRNLPGRLSNMVGARLERLGVDVTLIDAEVRTLDPVHVAPTANRSVLGILTGSGPLRWRSNSSADAGPMDRLTMAFGIGASDWIVVSDLRPLVFAKHLVLAAQAARCNSTMGRSRVPRTNQEPPPQT